MKTSYERAVLLLFSAALALSSGTPVLAAGTQMAAISSAASTVKGEPACDPDLARRVLVAKGILKSSQVTEKGLKKKVTRQEFAKLLVQISAFKDKVGTTVKTSMYADVKRTSAYAPYIRIAVEQGWMKANLSGKFRPKQSVTLQESVSAVLAVLGYTDSDFQGNLSSAKMSFYKAEKLNKNIKKKASAAMTYAEMSCLLYNMLVAETKSGTVYAETLGYVLDANGDIDYLPLVYDEMDGPVIAEENWQEQIPFDVSGATIFIDGTKSTQSSIYLYDVLYYSKKLKTIFVYQDRVTGRLNSVSPDRYTPSAVTVAGTSYPLANQKLAYEVSAMGSYEIGDYVTLLLGKDGKVVRIGEAAQLNSFIGGIVLSKTERVTDAADDTSVKKYITMLDTLGETHEYEVDDLKPFSERTPVEIAFDNGKPVVNKVTLERLNGVVNSDASRFSSYQLAESIRILEYDNGGSSSTIARSRLAGLTINASNILYYHVNADKEITDLVIRGVTGDNYTYGILTAASEVANAATMTFSGNYSYQIGDESGYAVSSGQTFGLQGYTGPAQFAFSADGSVTGVKTLGSITVTSITQTEVSNGRQAYTLADGVGVYLKKGTSYYATELSKVMSLNNYELTAYYDGTTGGRVRIIVAKAK